MNSTINRKSGRNYYGEIDKAISRFENLQYPIHKASWITNRIEWCFRFGKISREQMARLANRMTAVYKNETLKLYDSSWY